MAKDKKSFILYADLINMVSKLPKEKAGELFIHILEYVNDKNPVTEDLLINIAFEPIKLQLKRDLVKWESNIEQRRQAGIRSAESRSRKLNEIQRPLTTVKNRSTDSTDTVNVTVTVTDTDTDTVSKEEEIKLHSSKFKNFEAVVSLFNSKYFNEVTWLDCYDKLIRIDKYSEDRILEIVKEFRSDGNWWKDNGNFESLIKLRQKDKQKISYINLFNEKMPKNGTKEYKRYATAEDLKY